MGISGLLPFVKPASSEKHISDFKGQTAAIDSYCWLHRGAFGCAEKIVKGEPTDRYVTYCMKYIDMLLTFKIKPVMVFDGRHLPAKLQTEKKRRESRSSARKKAMEYLKLGKMEQARANFKKCVDISPEMALALIKECRRRGIDCIVAPYEADAQLAYLNISNMVDFIISEDSDLLPFGCKRVMYKLDLSGTGILVEREKLYLATQERPDSFSLDRFRYMCILSGCDYLDSLPGIGLKKALKFLKRIPESDIYNSITKMPGSLNMQIKITEEYRNQFMIADATFRHQLVFDPIKRKLIPLTDPVTCGTKLKYCCNAGDRLDNDVAFQIAIGNLEPFTLKVLDTWCPETASKCHINPSSSVWCKSYRLAPNAKRQIASSVVNCRNIIVDYKIQEHIPIAKEVDDNNEKSLIAIYSATEPVAKKICIREYAEDNEVENQNISTSPVLSGGRKIINPFIKKSRTKKTVFDEKSKVISKFLPRQNICSVNESTNNSQDNDQQAVDAEERIPYIPKSFGIEQNEPVTKKNDNEVVVVVGGQSMIVSKFFYKLKTNTDVSASCKNDDGSMENSDMELFPESQNNISTLGTNSNCDNNSSKEKNSLIFSQYSTNLCTKKNKQQADSQLLTTVEDSNNLTQDSQTSKHIFDIDTFILKTNLEQKNRDMQGEIKTCRQPGLRKRLSKAIKPGKNQPTLLSMFGFTKK